MHGLALLTLAAVPASAQFPRARTGQFEVRGLDFDRDGAWRRQGRAVMDARRQLLHRGAVALLNGPVTRPVVRGDYFIPVVPMAFADVPPPHPANAYQELFFAASPAARESLRSYYSAASRGNVTIDGRVFDWVRVPDPAAYYEDNCNGVGIKSPCPSHTVSRMYQLLGAALDSISHGPGADTVWNRYDNDGPDGIPNSGDDDGIVDLVAFLQPAVDGACDTPGIWSHRATFSLWNNGAPYLTRTPRRDASGRAIPGRFLTIDSYTLQSAVGGESACDAASIMPIGTVTHETGHAFGLPDLYDTDPATHTAGAGSWSLMGAGNYARAYSPASFDAWSLVQLGWVRVDTLHSGTVVTADPVQLSGTVYYAPTSTALYYLLENRGRVGTDTAQMNPAFRGVTQPGLLIWRIDDARIAQGMPTNRVNTGSEHGVALIQADGLDQLRTPGGNRGDGGDPFPGSVDNHDFGLATIPAASTTGFGPLELRIDSIERYADGRVAFRYLHGPPTVVRASDAVARVEVNGLQVNQYVEIMAPGDALTLSADSAQVSFDGRSRSRFTGWSDGGGATHVHIVRTGRPDTIIAAFDVDHRLRIAISGPGAVTADVPDVTAGVFLRQGTTVHLLARAAPGADFAGWRGDTTDQTALTLTMRRPIDLTAAFVTAVSIDAKASTDALLGGASLAASARDYLDAIGNQNGSYDVGDYLAWLQRRRPQ